MTAPEELGPFVTTVTVEPGGEVFAACSCGTFVERGHHDLGTERRVLQRLGAHVGLHVSAAAQGVEWSEVLRRRARLEATWPAGRSRRDDDPGE